MTLADYVTTFGQDLLERYGERVHKLAINAGFTCPIAMAAKAAAAALFAITQHSTQRRVIPPASLHK